MARPSLFVRLLDRGEMEFMRHRAGAREGDKAEHFEILDGTPLANALRFVASIVFTPVHQIALIFKTDEAYAIASSP